MGSTAQAITGTERGEAPPADDRQELESTIRQGEEVLKIKEQGAATDWEDWMGIGAGLAAGRTLAMLNARVSKPEGRRYSVAFSSWLSGLHYKTMDPDTRAALLRCHDRADLIEAWRREKLTPPQRLDLNHPRSVWRRYSKSLAEAEPKPKPDRTPARGKQREQHLELELREQQRDEALRRACDVEKRIEEVEWENARLKREKEELRAEVTRLAAENATLRSFAAPPSSSAENAEVASVEVTAETPAVINHQEGQLAAKAERTAIY
jgi:hypothetical protein